jgi:hypothetical protein
LLLKFTIYKEEKSSRRQSFGEKNNEEEKSSETKLEELTDELSIPVPAVHLNQPQTSEQQQQQRASLATSIMSSSTAVAGGGAHPQSPQVAISNVAAMAAAVSWPIVQNRIDDLNE